MFVRQLACPAYQPPGEGEKDARDRTITSTEGEDQLQLAMRTTGPPVFCVTHLWTVALRFFSVSSERNIFVMMQDVPVIFFLLIY